MMFVVIVTVVHKEHHYGASEKQQIRQHAEHMGSVLGEQEESGHGAKTHRGESARRPPER